MTHPQADRLVTCPRTLGVLGLEPKELGMTKHVVDTGDVIRKVAELAAA